MGQTFAGIVTRVNGTNVDANWWNILQLAGANLESWFGSQGFQGDTVFNVANNQVAAANVTGLIIDPTKIRSFELDIQVYRNTTGAGATEVAERMKIYGVFSTVAGTWEITQAGVGNSGVTISITNAGQIQYTSSNITGTAASSYLTYRYTTMGI